MKGRLKRWFDLERRLYGKADFFFKEECVSSKILAFYIRPFNPLYLYRYTTTRYPNTYFPGRKRGDEEGMLATEFHENVHKWDRWYKGILFNLGYGFPQILAIPFIIAVVGLSGPLGWFGFGVLLTALHAGLAIQALSVGVGNPENGYRDAIPPLYAKITFFILVGLGTAICVSGTILGGGLFAFLWAGAVLFLSPWPLKARWRRDAEIRGYVASLYWMRLKYNKVWDEKLIRRAIKGIVRNFTGPAYFYMEPDERLVSQELHWQVARFWGDEGAFLTAWCTSRDPQRKSEDEAEPYRMISTFVRQEGMINVG